MSLGTKSSREQMFTNARVQPIFSAYKRVASSPGGGAANPTQHKTPSAANRAASARRAFFFFPVPFDALSALCVVLYVEQQPEHGERGDRAS
jgi:hypothetical protein